MQAVNVENPYLNKLIQIRKSLIESGESRIGEYQHRSDLVKKYAWAIPNQKAIEEISKYGPIIELGAGSGYWASLIAKYGTEIVCFDDQSFKLDSEFWMYKSNLHHPVSSGSYDKLRDYRDHTLMLCWPDYDSDFALKSLKAYKGQYLIYIGEGWGGCTGCDDFHSMINSKWEEICCVDIPQWDCIRDALFIYERKA